LNQRHLTRSRPFPILYPRNQQHCAG